MLAKYQNVRVHPKCRILRKIGATNILVKAEYLDKQQKEVERKCIVTSCMIADGVEQRVDISCSVRP